MVVSFHFFLTLNSDDGSKPTPTMETQPVFDGDGKLFSSSFFFFFTFHSYSFHSCSELGKISALYVCLSFTIIFFFFNFRIGQDISFTCLFKFHYYFFPFFNFNFFPVQAGLPQPFKKMRNLQVTCAYSLPLEWSSVLPRLSACSPMSNKNMV